MLGTFVLTQTTPLLAWIGLERGLPAALLVSLSALGVAALVLLVRWERAGHVSPPGAALPALDPMPIVEVDVKGRVWYANPAAERLFPKLRKRRLTHPFLADLEVVHATLQEADAEPLVREVIVGEAVYEQHILRAPGHDGLCLYGLDITRRKRAAQARRRSEEKFIRVFRLAPMAISISRLADGRFLDVNDSFVELLGYEARKDIIGKNGLEVGLWAHGSDRAHVLELLSKADGAVYSLEMQVRHRDGSPRDVILSVELMDFDGELSLLATLLDVTEHRRAEAGIAILKAFYENTLKELPIQVSVLDEEGRFFYLNPAAMPDEEKRLAMFGKTSIEFAQAQGLDPQPYRRRHAWILDVIQHKKIGRLEEVLTDSDGDEQHLLHVAMPVLDENDELLYVIGYGMDITERKLFEQKLLEAKNAAEDMARLKSAFVANMSHEIRTPLTAILGFATVLAEELEAGQRELVSIIKQSGERLLETLNSVLDLARLEANALEVDPQPLDLTEELAAAVRLYRPMAQEKGLTFVLNVPSHTVHARLDRACLHRILSNLLSNAIKFTNQGEVRLALEVTGTDVHIQVEDTGIGIDASFMPYLFEEFKQESMGLARTHTGSGLGLAITRHLVERMHGQIEVDSTKGEGSTFTVTFPAMPTTSAPAEEPVEEVDASV